MSSKNPTGMLINLIAYLTLAFILRQQNETLWEYPALAFPRASMIDVQYQMPDFGAERRLAHPLGIKDTGDWSQDGQSLFVDGVSRVHDVDHLTTCDD